jgi:hypothetical protein
MSHFEVKFNPNTLLQFRRLFLLFKSTFSSETLCLYLSQTPSNPTLVFSSSFTKSQSTSSFSYFEFFDDTFIDDLQLEPAELLIEIADGSIFCKFLRSFSDKVSHFTLLYNDSTLTLIHAEGSEFRSRTIPSVKELQPIDFKDKMYPLKKSMQFKVITKEIAKISESFLRLDSSELLLTITKSPEVAFEVRLEVKGVNNMRTVIKSNKSSNLTEIERFRFLFDRNKAKSLSMIANIEEIAILGVTQEQEMFMGYEAYEAKGQQIYEMKFKVPHIIEMESRSDDEMDEEENEERRKREREKQEKKLEKMKEERKKNGKNKKEKERVEIEENTQDEDENLEFSKIKVEIEEYEDDNKKSSNIY